LDYQLLLDRAKIIENPLGTYEELLDYVTYIEVQEYDDNITFQKAINTSEVECKSGITFGSVSSYWEHHPFLLVQCTFTVNPQDRRVLFIKTDRPHFEYIKETVLDIEKICPSDEKINKTLINYAAFLWMLKPVPLQRGYVIGHLYVFPSYFFPSDNQMVYFPRISFVKTKVVDEKKLFDNQIDCWLLRGKLNDGSKLSVYVEKSTGMVIKEVIEGKKHMLIKTLKDLEPARRLADSANKIAGNWKTYENELTSFRINHPADWGVIESSRSDRVTLIGEEVVVEAGGGINIRVRSEGKPAVTLSLEEAFAEYSKDLKYPKFSKGKAGQGLHLLPAHHLWEATTGGSGS